MLYLSAGDPDPTGEVERHDVMKTSILHTETKLHTRSKDRPSFRNHIHTSWDWEKC